MIYNALTAILWITVLWRLPTLTQNRWKRAATVSLAALAAALTLGMDGVITAVGQLTGHPGLAVLAEFLAVIVSCAAVTDWVAALASPGARHRTGLRDVATVAVLVTMAALFAVMPAQPHPATGDLVTTAGADPAGAFLLLFFAYLTVSMLITALMCWRVTHTAPRGTVRAGTALLTAGLALAACYGANRIVYVTGRITSHLAGPGGSFLVSSGVALEYLAIAVILAGIALPALGTGWQAARDLHSLRTLRPLRRSLVAAVPAVSAGLPRTSPAATLMSPRGALIRATAEIRDAALQLRYAVPPQAIDQARTELANRGLAGAALDTGAEACWLA